MQACRQWMIWLMVMIESEIVIGGEVAQIAAKS